jgi:sensor histidine kinase YesM
MRYSEGLLGEFRGVGNPYAFIAAIVFIAVAYLGGAVSPWSARLAQLLSSYMLAFAGLSLIRSCLPWPQRFAVPFAIALLVVCLSAIWPAIALQSRAERLAFPRETLAFDFVLGLLFGGALTLPTLFVRRGEELRHRAEADRHARELEQQMHLKQLAEMRLKALHAQIEPHFLFNTLANVQHLLRTSPQEADLMLESLIQYLKSAVPQMRSGTSTVGEELARAEAYLAIMRVRMGDRLRYAIEVPIEVRTQALPPLSLITLIENAVKHGIEPRPAGGSIRIEGRLNGESLALRVMDDGVGFSSEIGSGIGLTNLRARLEAIHGSSASLELAARETGGVEAALTIPMSAVAP